MRLNKLLNVAAFLNVVTVLGSFLYVYVMVFLIGQDGPRHILAHVLYWLILPVAIVVAAMPAFVAELRASMLNRRAEQFLRLPTDSPMPADTDEDGPTLNALRDIWPEVLACEAGQRPTRPEAFLGTLQTAMSTLHDERRRAAKLKDPVMEQYRQHLRVVEERLGGVASVLRDYIQSECERETIAMDRLGD